MAKIVINIPDFLYKQILKKHVSKATIAKMFQNGAVLHEEKSIIKEWVPASERLPDKEGTYLLWGRLFDDEEYYCFIGDYDEGCERFGYWEERFDPHTFGCLGSEFLEYECVIAWQELPKPYKENKED